MSEEVAIEVASVFRAVAPLVLRLKVCVCDVLSGGYRAEMRAMGFDPIICAVAGEVFAKIYREDSGSKNSKEMWWGIPWVLEESEYRANALLLAAEIVVDQHREFLE